MSKFIITLQRIKEYEKVSKPASKSGKTYKDEGATIGKFIVHNAKGEEVFSSYCVENIGPSTDTPRQDRRIMPRTYKLYWTQSGVSLPKSYAPKCLSLYTDELPSFKERRIHIHIGNYPQDTEGCLLLNYADNKNGSCAQSTKAVEDFYNLVGKEGVENFELVVKEIV